MNTNIGMAGEFRCVVKREDGSIKIDTGYQKNLILDQGLDYFGSDERNYSFINACVVGTGNSIPKVTQTKLDNIIGYASLVNAVDKNDYDVVRDGNLYKTSRECIYSIKDLDNVNITEVGLASRVSSDTDYSLNTRALIKDSNGNPTTITVLSGEQLDIYYKVWRIFDLTDKTGTFNLLDGMGGSVAYNYKTRPAYVGTSSFANLELGAMGAINSLSLLLATGDLEVVTSAPTGGDSVSNDKTLSPYVLGSYKRVVTISLPLSVANFAIRSMLVSLPFIGTWQVRFGSVVDDSPITKTDTQTLTIPVEFSWGRYEGAL